MKFFNTAGPCAPVDHYMLPPERRLPEVRLLIDRKLYFVIHAPRQSGKTTCFETLAHNLTMQGRYAALHATCEKGQTAGSDVEKGVRAVLRDIDLEAAELPAELRPEPLDHFESIEAESRLGAYLAAWCRRSPLPVVLFLDEIDALQDDTLLSVLRQLRAGYSDRPERFPQSVALIGLRDVPSQFNVAAESLTLRNFTEDEISDLYDQYGFETGQFFTAEAKASAWALSRGQPWLVNSLARLAIEALGDDRLPIKASSMVLAQEILVNSADANLGFLLHAITERRLRKVVQPIVSGGLLSPDCDSDDFLYAKDLGLITSGPSGIEMANPIYLELVLRALLGMVRA